VSGAYLSFFIAGLVIATLVFVLRAHSLWRQYNDVLARGHIEESDTKRNVLMYGVVSAVCLLICFEMLVFFGFIPGIDFLIVPAFMIGLTIIPWYALLLVIIWEARSGCRLYLTRKGRNASMSVIRRS
jgi:hypothetical protein